MKFLSTIVFFVLFWISVLLALDPSASISGFVFDEEDGESLIGANIYIEGQRTGAVSNISGYYVLTGLTPGNYTLKCTYVGYKDYSKQISIRANEKLKLNIVLQSSAFEADAIVVTADSVPTAVQLFQKPISKIAITPQEIKQMPAIAEADLLRTLQSLPGILPISDYSSEIYVRGGAADQNLYLIDGADVYNPDHAFGLFSTFNTDAIKNVEISKGGFGAEYGGRLSSILNVTNLDGNRKHFEGTVEISLLSAKTTLQMPLSEHGSLSASFRRTYFDQTAARFIDDVPDYYFYDGHIKAYFDVNSNNKLTLSTYYGRDVLEYAFGSDAEDAESIHYNWGNATGSLRWTHIFHPTVFANFWVTASRFSSLFELSEIEEENDLTDLSFKGQFEAALSDKIYARFGFEHKNLHTNLQQDSPGGIIDVERDRDHSVGYLSLDWQPLSNWYINPGLRYNYFEADRSFSDWAPRFSTKYRLTETINLKFATGRYYQYLNRVPRPFIADIWITSDENYSRSSSDHFILGFQKEVAGNLELEIETYYKAYDNIYDLKKHFTDIEPQEYDGRGRPVYTETIGLFDIGEGNSRGIEFLLRKKYGSITGWLAYALARTEYTVRGINQDEPFVPRHDRTSVFNTVLNLEIKNGIRELRNMAYKSEKSKWLLGLNFVYSSGQPITLTGSTYKASTFPDRNYEDILLYPSDINDFRLPSYIRLDMSVTYKRKFKYFILSSYLQIYNIGNRENVWFIQYEDRLEDDKIIQEVETFNMLPLLPTVGVRFEF